MKKNDFQTSITIAAGIFVSISLLSFWHRAAAQVPQVKTSGGVEAPRNGNIVKVTGFGAKGDGVADDTKAIRAAIDAAKEGSTIYFPAGVYLVSNLTVERRAALSFAGDGRNSVIKQIAGSPRLATFNECSDISIRQLAFDANGIDTYGGVVFYAAKRIQIENNWFIDSAPKPVGATDRYSFVFAKGSLPSQDIVIRNNTIEDLQLEVDHSRRVRIDGNRVSRSVLTSGIGIYSVGDDAVAEEYLITRNTIIDPFGSGISVVIDPPKSRNSVFRKITIANNEILLTKRAVYGVRLGTGDNSQASAGNVFEDIVVKDNRLRVSSTVPAPRQAIFANTSTSAAIVFNRLSVTGNMVENAASGGNEFAIDLRRIQHSVVAGNTIRNVSKGISLARDLRSNDVRNNVVEASEIAYLVEGSLGGNKASNNQVVGRPTTPWKTSTLNASDLIEP